ncbi:MAG TPA: hypothetical protein VE954_34475, partial [Oligoflexus sp.]|uniref:hypothetical protein n=1 Tax=Oligoflexus sp. TaxID=1971216 RepID=UPI002D45E211
DKDKDKEQSPGTHFNPSKIEGNYFVLNPWRITTPAKDGDEEYVGDKDRLGSTLTAVPFSFDAIINARTGATQTFLTSIEKDSCSNYREASLPGEASGRTSNGGYWFAMDDVAGNFVSYAANVRHHNICLTLNINPEAGSEKFSSKDSDLIEYFNRFVETAEFQRLGAVYSGYFNNRTFLYTVLFSDNFNEEIKDADGVKHTHSSAPILTIDGQENEVVSESFFGDCQLDIFRNALADEKKKNLAVSHPSDDLAAKYSLELTTEPNGTFNRVAEGFYSTTKAKDCLIVRYRLKTPIRDAALAASDSELDDMFVGALGEMLVSKVP